MQQDKEIGIVKVATVEDSAVVSDRLRSLLSELDGVHYIGNAASIDEAMELIRAHEPDIVILDIHLRSDQQRLNGMSLIPVIKAGWPDTLVIMFTNFSDHQYRQRCMELGADYFFDKSEEPEQMMNVIRQAHLQPAVATTGTRRRAEASADHKYQSVVSQQAAMLNAVPGSAALLDSRGVIVAANDAWAGFAAQYHLAVGDFAVGQDYLARIAVEFGQAGSEVIAGIRQVLAGLSNGYTTEYDCILSDRHRRFMLSVTPASVMGEPGAMVLRTDITEQQGHLRARLTSESNLLAIIESTEDIIFSLDRDLRYITFNTTMARIVRSAYGHEIATGSRVVSVLEDIDPAEAKTWEGYYARAFAGQVVRFVKEYPAEGGKVYYKFIINPIWQQGAVAGVSCFGRDVTQYYEMQKQIKELNESLEQKVMDRTEELQAFSYMVSHDLKSPLRIIGGYAALLAQSYGGQLNEDALSMLGIISSHTVKMNKLIDGLLRFSRYGRQEMHTAGTDMDSIVRSVIQDVVMTRDTPPVKVKVGNVKSAVCDPDLIRQVWFNLISNAVKYTSHKSIAEIAVGMVTVGEEEAYYIRDNGAGFDMKYASRLFEVFQRLHSTDQFEGSGIGLATVHKIIQRHGGRIWAEAEPDRGATFYFTLGAATTTC